MFLLLALTHLLSGHVAFDGWGNKNETQACNAPPLDPPINAVNLNPISQIDHLSYSQNGVCSKRMARRKEVKDGKKNPPPNNTSLFLKGILAVTSHPELHLYCTIAVSGPVQFTIQVRCWSGTSGEWSTVCVCVCVFCLC